MSARLLDGKVCAKEIRGELKAIVPELELTPHLAAVQVGDNPASSTYVRSKRRAAKRIGIETSYHHLDADISQGELMDLVSSLNADPAVHGILVQLPLADHHDESEILLAIDPDKDVDGFHPVNVGRLSVGLKGFAPCTPAGVVELLKRNEISISGKHAVIIGRSNIVGRPLATLLSLKADPGNATVTLCHSRTPNIAELCRRADIIVAAIGRANFVTADFVSAGQVVVDVGINHVDAPETEKGYRLVGDVDFEPVAEVVEAITPVPGGVGPMTIAMLMSNVVESARRFGAS